MRILFYFWDKKGFFRPSLHEGLGLIAFGTKIECFGPTIGLNNVINYTILWIGLKLCKLLGSDYRFKIFIFSPFFLSSSFKLPMQEFEFLFSSLLSHFLTLFFFLNIFSHFWSILIILDYTTFLASCYTTFLKMTILVQWLWWLKNELKKLKTHLGPILSS